MASAKFKFALDVPPPPNKWVKRDKRYTAPIGYELRLRIVTNNVKWYAWFPKGYKNRHARCNQTLDIKRPSFMLPTEYYSAKDARRSRAKAKKHVP